MLYSKMVRLFLFLFCFVQTFAQKRADTLRLFYPINETESVDNYKKLDSVLSIYKNTHKDVAVYGYADFLSSKAYNKRLSELRANAIKKYILLHQQNNQYNIYACEGKGETFSNDNSGLSGEPFQRRVDIIFEPVVIMQIPDSKLEDVSSETITKKPVAASVKKELHELEAGESLSLEGLSFEPGRHFILKESAPVLQQLLKTLKDKPGLKIEIRGHVCCTLNGLDGLDLDTREMKLSENRAKSIYDYLISKGISKNRLTYVGLGRSEPKYLIESTPEEEQANRRVEIKVIEK